MVDVMYSGNRKGGVDVLSEGKDTHKLVLDKRDQRKQRGMKKHSSKKKRDFKWYDAL